MKRLAIVAVVLAGLLCGSRPAGANPVAEGDALYAQREDTAKCLQAVERYTAAFGEGALRPKAAWRLARAHYWLGTAAGTREEAEKHFSEGVEWGKKAVALAPGDPAAHYWLGVCYGKWGEGRGVLKSLSLVEPIKAEMEEVIRLERTYEHGGAYRVLGRLYHKLPGIFGGSNKKAEAALKEALAIDPANVSNHFSMAEFLIAKKRNDEARRELEAVLALAIQPDRAGEDKRAKADAAQLLGQLK